MAAFDSCYCPTSWKDGLGKLIMMKKKSREVTIFLYFF